MLKRFVAFFAVSVIFVMFGQAHAQINLADQTAQIGQVAQQSMTKAAKDRQDGRAKLIPMANRWADLKARYEAVKGSFTEADAKSAKKALNNGRDFLDADSDVLDSLGKALIKIVQAQQDMDAAQLAWFEKDYLKSARLWTKANATAKSVSAMCRDTYSYEAPEIINIQLDALEFHIKKYE